MTGKDMGELDRICKVGMFVYFVYTICHMCRDKGKKKKERENINAICEKF